MVLNAGFTAATTASLHHTGLAPPPTRAHDLADLEKLRCEESKPASRYAGRALVRNAGCTRATTTGALHFMASSPPETRLTLRVASPPFTELHIANLRPASVSDPKLDSLPAHKRRHRLPRSFHELD